MRDQFGRLQTQFDQAADDWSAEAPRLREQGEGLVRQRATAFMQRHVEAFETVLAERPCRVIIESTPGSGHRLDKLAAA